MCFFELRTPRHILEKARREHSRLTDAFNIDNVFNFFVTAYHIQDYIRQTAAVPQPTLDAFLRDPDLAATRDLCDKGKHLRLTRRPDPSAIRSAIGPLNTAPLNTIPLNYYAEVWALHSGNRTFDVAALANRVIQKWEAFFTANGL
jgi:hypothetical protein